jgi:hypothetical protein
MKLKETTSLVQSRYKAVTNIHEQKSKAISKLKEAGQRAFRREGLFADEHYAILLSIR